MKLSFSTLACPDWTLEQVIDLAVEESYHGIELRFLENEDSLWKLPCFQGDQLRQSRSRITDAGLSVCCVDTSCRFDSPDSDERERWIEEGRRMSNLAAELRAPGIRIFADQIHPSTDREATRAWVVDGLRRLADETAGSGVQVWLETHGDFCTAFEVQRILSECPAIALVWDPAPAFIAIGEQPFANGAAFHGSIRHVHIKDLRRQHGQWIPVLTGEGEFPLGEVRALLDTFNYDGFLSFEWEKKWHPAIDNPEVALPHFAEWFRRNWEKLRQT